MRAGLGSRAVSPSLPAVEGRGSREREMTWTIFGPPLPSRQTNNQGARARAASTASIRAILSIADRLTGPRRAAVECRLCALAAALGNALCAALAIRSRTPEASSLRRVSISTSSACPWSINGTSRPYNTPRTRPRSLPLSPPDPSYYPTIPRPVARPDQTSHLTSVQHPLPPSFSRCIS